MQEKIPTLGDAKSLARKNAKRDGCEWHVWWDSFYKSYTVAEPFVKKDAYWTSLAYTAKPFDDKDKNAEGMIALTLTPEQAELIQWILEDEEDRQVYPGSEKEKLSLLDMILGKKVKSA